MIRIQWAAAAAAMLLAGTALAVTPAQKCESDKNKEAGKYARCRQEAEAKYALTGDGAARTLALQKCADNYGEKWPAIEDKAGGVCPSTGDRTAIQQYLDTATTNAAAALAGGTLAGQGQRLKTGQTQCWSGFSSVPIACAGTGKDGELQKGLDRLYVDNGDGTITDMKTGLMWEKLSYDGSIHDRGNEYSWADAYAYKVAALNVLAFAGHIDWRVPNVNELQSLLNYGVTFPAVSPAFNTGCVAGCTVLTCSCGWTAGYGGSELYWSSSTLQQAPFYVWTVGVYDGSVGYTARNEQRHVRAVRGGSSS